MKVTVTFSAKFRLSRNFFQARSCYNGHNTLYKYEYKNIAISFVYRLNYIFSNLIFLYIYIYILEGARGFARLLGVNSKKNHETRV